LQVEFGGIQEGYCRQCRLPNRSGPRQSRDSST
jgi:hypothetical protein